MSITLGANIVELYPGALRGYFQQASGTFDAHPDNLNLKRVFAYGETLNSNPPSSSSIADLEAYWYECDLDLQTSPTSWKKDGTILTGYVNTPPGPPPPAGTFWVIPVWDDGSPDGEIGQATSQDYSASAA